MPNWCNNFVQINHTDPAKISLLAEAIKAGKFCDHVIPVHEDLQITAGRLGDAVEQAELEAKEQANLAKYGAKNWYDFCVNHWGTKWDVDPYGPVEVEADGTHVSFGFDSAWAPPTGVYAELVEQGFSVDAMYYEPGMGFCGRWVNGDDIYWELGGMTSDEVAEMIDQDVDEQFAITESMAEWEQENINE